MVEVKFEALTSWLSDDELNRFCKACGVVVPGFRTPDKAPRHLQMAALNRDVSNLHYYRHQLARGWKQRRPELWEECEAFAHRLNEEPDLDPVPWMIDLGQRTSTTNAFLTTFFVAQLTPALEERFFSPEVWRQVVNVWRPKNHAEHEQFEAKAAARAEEEQAQAAARSELVAAAAMSVEPPAPAPDPAPVARATPAAEPAPAVVAERRLAAQAKRLQQSLRLLQKEMKVLARELAAVQAEGEAARAELARLRAERERLRAQPQWPHPAARTRRLVTALQAAWIEEEHLWPHPG